MAVIGGIIGGGIFRTPAAVAERVGSPGLAIAAWVVGDVVASSVMADPRNALIGSALLALGVPVYLYWTHRSGRRER